MSSPSPGRRCWAARRPWHADPQPARGRAAGKLHTCLAAAEDLPLTKGGKLIEGIFVGETINTPSMLCVEDYLDALTWAKSSAASGPDRPRRRQCGSAHRWVERTRLDRKPRQGSRRPAPTRPSASRSLPIPDIAALMPMKQAAFAKAMAKRLEAEGVALDIGAYRDAPAGPADLVRCHGRASGSRGADALARLGLGPRKPRSAGRLIKRLVACG
jgi:phosphoserine aminotransferase